MKNLQEISIFFYFEDRSLCFTKQNNNGNVEPIQSIKDHTTRRPQELERWVKRRRKSYRCRFPPSCFTLSNVFSCKSLFAFVSPSLVSLNSLYLTRTSSVFKYHYLLSLFPQRLLPASCHLFHYRTLSSVLYIYSLLFRALPLF